jgi:hypothetical protein
MQDAYQGREMDVIILSCTRAPRSGNPESGATTPHPHTHMCAVPPLSLTHARCTFGFMQ